MSNTQVATRPVAVVGGGLAGSLMAVALADRGYKVDVYERRADMRLHDDGGGRSINLALSERGLSALRSVGLEERARALCIPMRGRMIHTVDGQTHLQPYGQEDQYINSISRKLLNELLMDAAQARGQVAFHFEQRCDGYDPETGALHLHDLKQDRSYSAHPQVILGADGAGSPVRQAMQRHVTRFNMALEYLPHGYKELSIPPGPDGRHQLEPNALHIWPRSDFMMIALPNLDGSFTCTLFLAFEGDAQCFAKLQTPDDVEAFFHAHFGDARPLMTTLHEDFFKNPTGSLGTVRCAPYHHADLALILGDAAHAIVPFYGQGMNAAFEDCEVLASLIDAYGGRWGEVLPRFTQARKANADAIADLAMYNYVEMRHLVRSRAYVARKKLDQALHRLAPTAWVPLYTMVSFTTIPYAEARARAARQDAVVERAGRAALGAAVLGVSALVLSALLGRKRRKPKRQTQPKARRAR